MKGIAYKASFMQAAVIVAVFSLISRVLGLLRVRLMAAEFGASQDFDAYLAAFKVPDVVFSLIVLGALSSAFIPVFTEYLEKKQKKRAWQLVSSLTAVIVLAMIVICAILFVIMPLVTKLIVPGFGEAERELVVQLSRIMLLSPIILGISNIASGILNSFKKFLIYSLSPVFYNLGIIAGIVFLAPRWGVHGVAIGVVLGALLHLAIQVPSVAKLGFRFKFFLNMSHKGVKKVVSLMGPRILGLAAYQLNLFVSNGIASTLTIGSITFYNIANDIQSVVYSIIGVAMSTAVFPFLSTLYAQDKEESFVRTFSATLRRILFIVIPLSLMMILLRAQIVRLLLGTGQFDWEDTVYTASVLGYFAISLFAQSLIPLLAKTFYAMQDTKTPVIVSIVSMVINVILSFIFVKFIGVAGLALAFSIASFANMILLLFVLHLKAGNLEDRKIFISITKIVIASVVMVMVMQGMTFTQGAFSIAYFPGIKSLLADMVDMQRFWGVLVQAAGAVIMGGFIYLLVGRLLNIEEWSMVKNSWRKIWKTLKKISP